MGTANDVETALRELAQPRFFHGGVPGLKPGQKILSRAALPEWRGREPMYDDRTATELGDNGTYTHITTDQDVARAYAGEYCHLANNRKPGTLYEVTPIGEVDADPDWSGFPLKFLRARAARIVTVIEDNVFHTNPRYMARATAPYRVAVDAEAAAKIGGDGRFYDPDGYVAITDIVRRHGGTRQKSLRLGKWIPVHMVHFSLDLKGGWTLPPEL